MAETTDPPKNRLQKLRESFAAQLPEKLAQIGENWEKVKVLGAQSEETKQFALMLHTLAGSAPSFGFKEIGLIIREMEKLIKGIEGNAVPAQEIKNKMATQIDELISSTGVQAKQESVKVEVSQNAAPAANAESMNLLVFIVQADSMLAEHLATQVGYFGYEVRFFSDLASMITAVSKSVPAAIIADMSFPDGDFAGADAVIQMRQKDCPNTPVIFLSQRNHLEARLKAVQAGGEAYFLRPVALSDLMEKLDPLVFKKANDPYRILIVDDDVELSELHAAILQEYGITTRVVNDPMQILKHMVGFRPDLVLLDMYMPGCNGHELAMAIRQIEDYDGIPIVFLSAEMSLDVQLAAIRMGGDDFLTKPVPPEILISSVNIRAERMRIMRTFMAHDSLTRLLNLTKTQEQLDLALPKAKKNNSSCALAIMELDNLQDINDKHGYLTGDRVIMLTALLIKRRVRITDTVGHHVGSKFAVIMPDTDAETAFALIDGIRESFAKILHECHHAEFYLTLSGGIAVYPTAKDAVELNGDAEKALTAAINNGKNRIQLAGAR
jgi:diguanylate cyclase (GGDEF)-like protein